MQISEKYLPDYKLNNKNTNKSHGLLMPLSGFESKVKLTRDVTRYTVGIVDEIKKMVIHDTIGTAATGMKRSRYGR